MRVNDIFIFADNDNMAYDAIIDENEVFHLIQSIPYRSTENIQKEYDLYSVCEKELELIKNTFSSFADIHGDTFVVRKEAVQDILYPLYERIKDVTSSISFEEFCSEDGYRKMYSSSTYSPILIYSNPTIGLIPGILEDFLRMPDFMNGSYKVIAIYSRH